MLYFNLSSLYLRLKSIKQQKCHNSPWRWLDPLLIDLSTAAEGWPWDRLGCDGPCFTFELEGMLPWECAEDRWLPGTEAEGCTPWGLGLEAPWGIPDWFDECLGTWWPACFGFELAYESIWALVISSIRDQFSLYSFLNLLISILTCLDLCCWPNMILELVPAFADSLCRLKSGW